MTGPNLEGLTRTSGTDRICPRVPECWWDNPEVLSWLAAQPASDDRPKESRVQQILRIMDRGDASGD